MPNIVNKSTDFAEHPFFVGIDIAIVLASMDVIAPDSVRKDFQNLISRSRAIKRFCMVLPG